MTNRRDSKSSEPERRSSSDKLFSEMVPDPDAPTIAPALFIKYFQWSRGEKIEKKLFSHRVATLIGGPTHPSAGRGKPQILSFKDALLMEAAADINSLVQWPFYTQQCVFNLRVKWNEIFGNISWKDICAQYDKQPDDPERFTGFDWGILEDVPKLILQAGPTRVSPGLFHAGWLQAKLSEPLSVLWERGLGGEPQLIFQATKACTEYTDRLAFFLLYEKTIVLKGTEGRVVLRG